MNLDYLSHIFSTKTGASLSSYIMDERMAAAFLRGIDDFLVGRTLSAHADVVYNRKVKR